MYTDGRSGLNGGFVYWRRLVEPALEPDTVGGPEDFIWDG